MGVSNCRFAVRAPAPFRQLPARARRPPDYIATRRRAASRRHPKVARLAAIGVHAGATQSPQCFSQRQPRGRRNPKRWGRTSWSEAHAAGVTGAWGEGGRVGCARRAVLLFRRLCTSYNDMCHEHVSRSLGKVGAQLQGFFSTLNEVPQASRVAACKSVHRARKSQLQILHSSRLVNTVTYCTLCPPIAPVPGLPLLMTSHSTHSHLGTPRHARVLAMG